MTASPSPFAPRWHRLRQEWKAYLAQTQPPLLGEKVLLAISGGVDSMVLLELFASLYKELQLGRLGVAYIDHGMRPDETPQEIQLIQRVCESHEIPCFVKTLQWPKRWDSSLQGEARRLRREALESLMQEESFSWVATAHHADDQAETLLLRLLRGTTPQGLVGIWPRQGHWLHPMLCWNRATILEVAQGRLLAWCEDSTNKTQKYRRNQLRHSLLPFLENNYNPRIRDALCRLAQNAQEDEVAWEQILQERFQAPLIQREEAGLAIELSLWDTLPLALQRRCLKRATQEMWGHDLQTQHIQHIWDLTQGREGEKWASLPQSCRVVRRYGKLLFLHKENAKNPLANLSPSTWSSPFEERIVPIHGEGLYPSPWGQLKVQAHTTIKEPSKEFQGVLEVRNQNVEKSQNTPLQKRQTPQENCELSSQVAWFAYVAKEEMPSFPWCLRMRRPRDVVPLREGHQRLTKWMQRAKIPASTRSHLPLLATGDKILWLLGRQMWWPLQKEPPNCAGWLLQFQPNTHIFPRVSQAENKSPNS